MDSNDDLDAFFDEVDEVEEEVKKQVVINDDVNNVTSTTKPETGEQKGKVEEVVGPPPKKARIASNDVNTGPVTVVVSKKAFAASAPPQPVPEHHEAAVHQITLPKAIQPPLPPPPPAPITEHAQKNKKTNTRLAAGKTWTDESLDDFPENDYRLFIGNLAKDINSEKLAAVFEPKYPSFFMARVIFDKVSTNSKGFGFVSLLDAKDCARAIREMDQAWVGSRPIRVKRSEWKEKDLKVVRKGKRKGRKNQRW